MNPHNSDPKFKQRRFELSKTFLKYGWTTLALLLLVALVIFPACTGEGPTPTAVVLRAASADLLVDPWNPVAGSNWAYDRWPQNAIQDMGIVADPQTGLWLPWRLDHADVTVQEDLPIGVTAPNDDWLTLDTATEISVPSDAWADWDADTQEFIEAGTGVTAMTKVVAYYPEDVLDVPYHDGSTLSDEDFILPCILQFDRAKPTSDIYDVSYVSGFTAFISHFKGITFDFDQPGYGVVVTYYDDLWYLDAEWIVQYAGIGFAGYPLSNYGEFNFENTSLGILAESKGELSFSHQKATVETNDWLSYIGGPSLGFLSDDLDDVLDSGSGDYQYIPYEPTMGDYITPSEAEARYQNLKDFYDEYGHFYPGTGPYYLDSVDFSGKVVDLKKFTDYDLPGDLFFDFVTPAPSSVPSVTGGWFDEMVLTAEPVGSAAITKLQNDQLDIYAFGMADSDLFATVEADSDLSYYAAAGTFNEFTFNPANNTTDPFFDNGQMNPLAIREVREALQWAIDRDYIVGDIMGGLANARYTALSTISGDYIRFYDDVGGEYNTVSDLEDEYAYDFSAADTAIQTAMLAVANVTRVGGDYKYNGADIPMIVLTRTEDERQQFGDYLVTQLQDLGFPATTAQYGTSTVLGPIWQGNPHLGLWNAYTGGWINTSIPRDEATNFGDFYTPLGWPGNPLWEAYTPLPAFFDAANDLYNKAFTTIAQRDTLMNTCLPLSMEDNVRMFLVDRLAFSPQQADVVVAADAAAGVYGCWMWAATIHFEVDGVPVEPLN
jgi:hypothetical protein